MRVFQELHRMRTPKRDDREQPTLAFDVTQEIDPALADEILRGGGATLTQTDFEEITVQLGRERQREAYRTSLGF